MNTYDCSQNILPSHLNDPDLLSILELLNCNHFRNVLSDEFNDHPHSSSGSNIYTSIAGDYFRFIDVQGNGDYFYHSILKSRNILGRFKTAQNLRSYLSCTALFWFQKDEILNRIFQSYRIDYTLKSK